MANRRVPPSIAEYLGPCREPDTAAENVVEQVGLALMFGETGYVDYAPLVWMLTQVTDEMRDEGLSLDEEANRAVWLEAVEGVQNGWFEHNHWLPCRYCDKKFLPVVNERLFELFVTWSKSRKTSALMDLHRCPDCGGCLEADGPLRTYNGDYHTPEPHSIEDDECWVSCLFQHYAV